MGENQERNIWHSQITRLSIPGAEQELRKRTRLAAGEKYGRPLPKEIEERIEREHELIRNSRSDSWFIVASEVVKTLEAGSPVWLSLPHFMHLRTPVK